MYIKKFNESNEEGKEKITEVHCVIMCDSGGHIMEDECKCFYDIMKAADYIIKEVNSEYDKDYESFYDEDGSRFFTNIDENEDWEECILYLEENEIELQLVSIPIE
jgi:chloramphenicol O-acetyltransferase